MIDQVGHRLGFKRLPAVIATAGCEFDVDSPRSTTETLRKLGIWEQTSRPLGEAKMEQIAGDYPLVAEIVRYRRERRRSREIEAICAAAKKGRIYPSLSGLARKFAHVSIRRLVVMVGTHRACRVRG